VREDPLQQGLHVTEVGDRQYLSSIDFREPGGVLFEVATMPPESSWTSRWIAGARI
jgi:glyoxalase family protein